MTPLRFSPILLAAMLAISAPGGRDAQAAPAAAGASLAGDPHRGQSLYETRCGACHSLDANRIGPRHRGVVGRRAGTVPGFAYSSALRASDLVWTKANLDRWLTAPTSLVKGTAMGFRTPAVQDRADIIAYLAGPAVAGAKQPSTGR